MATIKDYISGQIHTLTAEALKYTMMAGELLPIKGKGLEVVSDTDIPDFSLRVVQDRAGNDQVIFLPKHDDAKRWYRNWFAVRCMKITGKDMPWGREYVRQSRSVKYANEDDVILLTAEFDDKLAIDIYRQAKVSAHPMELLQGYGFKINTSATRVRSALEMIGKIWAL